MLKHFATKVKSLAEIPSGKHFAILIFKSSSVHVPGDERSRTNPGHGYPAHDVTYESYEYWVVKSEKNLKESEKNLKEAIGFLEEQKKEKWKANDPYQVIEAKPVKIQTRIEVEVGP